MKLHNTLNRQTEEFKPLKDGEVSLYTCGPTVYDHVHIGNFRTYLLEDLLRRTLKSNGLKVNHVMNITDVDDKTIRRSRELYPDDEPKEALKKLTSQYETVFLDDAKKLGIDFSGSQIARATEHIPQMQALIKEIPGKYVSDDGVYFDIAKDDQYGVLVNLNRDHEHHRINNDEYDKDHVADFALWKVEHPSEPTWEFELDGKNIAGRPGWHIECSAMSTQYLGQPFDIHTGGVDLMFPHHENEIAQSRAAKGVDLAKVFVHGEHLLVDGKKMSKSLNNFYTLDDIIKKDIDPLAFRLLALQSHYRSQLNFTWESLEAAQANLNSLRAWADQVHQPAQEQISAEAEAQLQGSVKDAVYDDLNAAKALAALNETIDKAAPTQGILEFLDNLLGLGLSGRNDITGEQKELIAQRNKAREDQDWAKADELRNQLAAQDIEIRDTDNGAVWARI